MEELEALRKLVEEHNYTDALALIDEMDEMAKDDKITKIESFLVVLLVHLIKKQVEQRITNSWQRSINHALFGIVKTNKRRIDGGNYLKPDELKMAINEIMAFALSEAAEEAFGGAFREKGLEEMVDSQYIKQNAFDLIMTYKLS